MVSGCERRSLFLHVTRAEAEVSIVASLKYLVNHFFEMYGIEVGMVLNIVCNSLVASLIIFFCVLMAWVYIIQWNLQTTDTLGAGVLSTVERLSLSRRFANKPRPSILRSRID